MKNFLVIFLFLFIFVLNGCSSNSIDDESNNSNLNSSYVSKEHGIEITYPSNWYLYDYERGNTNLGGITISPVTEKDVIKNPSSGLNLTVVGKKEISEGEFEPAITKLSDTWNKIILNSNLDISAEVKESEVYVGGVKMNKAEFENIKIFSGDADSDSDEYFIGNGVNYYFIYNNKTYMIRYYYLRNEVKYASILENIVSQIKFSNL